MGQPTLTHESRCLVILVGGVLERCIENRARTIAADRTADEVTQGDVEKATADFLEEDLSDLRRLVQQAMDKHRYCSNKAA